MTTLYLVRHAPVAAPAGTFIGSTDLPLAGTGLEPLSGVARRLAGVDCWWCSPMLRARQTLEKIVQADGPAVPRFDDRLREIDFGRWEEKRFAEIVARDPGPVDAWQEYADFSFPRGEAVADFVQRVGEMLAVFSSSGLERIAVVTHGGVIRTMICLALGLPARHYLLFDVRPASLSVLELFDRGGVLKGLNL